MSGRVFISSSRKDLEEAQTLRDARIGAGFDAYLDLHDIAPGAPRTTAPASPPGSSSWG